MRLLGMISDKHPVFQSFQKKNQAKIYKLALFVNSENLLSDLKFLRNLDIVSTDI